MTKNIDDYGIYNMADRLILVRDRPFNLKGRLWFFVLFKNFFSDNTELEYLFFLSKEAQFFFPEFNIRLYDKNSESDFFFLHQNQQHWESEYFFRKKPVWLLNPTTWSPRPLYFFKHYVKAVICDVKFKETDAWYWPMFGKNGYRIGLWCWMPLSTIFQLYGNDEWIQKQVNM